MAPPVAPVPAPMAPAAPMPGVYVELRADSVGVRISEVVGENWVPVCYVPCRRVLPRNRIYVIEGSGIKATTRFMLPDDRAQLTLDVQAGSRVQQMGGAVLMAAGLATSYVALVFEGSSTASMSGSSNRSDTAGLFALGGLAAAALGLVLVVSAQTKVQSSSGASFSEAAPGRPRRAPRPAVALTARGLEF